MLVQPFLENVATYLLPRNGAAFGKCAFNFPLLLALHTSNIYEYPLIDHTCVGWRMIFLDGGIALENDFTYCPVEINVFFLKKSVHYRCGVDNLSQFPLHTARSDLIYALDLCGSLESYLSDYS
jgi:hypothetical protein